MIQGWVCSVTLITVTHCYRFKKKNTKQVCQRLAEYVSCEETPCGSWISLRNNWCVSIFVVPYKYRCLVGLQHNRAAQVSLVHVALHRAPSDLAICSTSEVGFHVKRSVVFSLSLSLSRPFTLNLYLFFSLTLSYSISRNNASLYHCSSSFNSSSCSGQLLLLRI